ncbi:MAG: urease accessory protein UreD [Pelagimonas sp.]|nr:urease accessory protein UreD [Pelagimonas sp.]
MAHPKGRPKKEDVLHRKRSAITHLRRISSPSVPQPAIRARGVAKLAVRADGSRSRLSGLHQSGALKCLFPRTRGGAVEAVLINTSGGVTGGDHFTTEARIEPNANLTLTTQTCERAYRALPGAPGRVETKITVADKARLNWVPQETILFQQCDLARDLHITLAKGASALVVEPLIFGRRAMGETLTQAALRDRITVTRGGAPVYMDRITMQGDLERQLDRPGVAAGARALASLIYIAPDAEARLASIRSLLPPTAGASLIGDDLLVTRVLATDGYELRQSLIPLLTLLMPDGLPRCWTL